MLNFVFQVSKIKEVFNKYLILCQTLFPADEVFKNYLVPTNLVFNFLAGFVDNDVFNTVHVITEWQQILLFFNFVFQASKIICNKC
jgi:hypothetical protein